MIKPVLLLAATALALTACGSGSGGTTDAAKARLSAIKSAEGTDGSGDSSTPDSSGDSSTRSGSGSDYTTVDVCSLLSSADAIAVVRADGLDPAQTASTVYTVTAKKEDVGAQRAACRFSVDDGAQEGTVVFETQPGSAIDEYNDGTKVAGLGDEAYTNESGGTVVRVGDVVLSEGDDAFSSQITLDFLRKMAPHLS